MRMLRENPHRMGLEVEKKPLSHSHSQGDLLPVFFSCIESMNGPMELSSKNNSIHTVYVCLLVNNTEHYYGSLQTRLAKFILFFLRHSNANYIV